MSLVGNLEDLGLGDIFQIVSLSRRSGTLQLTTPAASGEIVFSAGKVVAAYRSGSLQTVGESLLAADAVSPAVYQEMLAAQAKGVSGPALLSTSDLDKDKVLDALDEALKQTIYDIFDWSEGTFSFVLEENPDLWRGFSLDGTRAVSERGLNPQYLAIEGARIRDERTKEDSLESFLARGQPTAQEKLSQAPSENAQQFAKNLGDDEPSSESSDAQSRPSESPPSQAQTPATPEAPPEVQTPVALEPQSQPQTPAAPEAPPEVQAPVKPKPQLETPGSPQPAPLPAPQAFEVPPPAPIVPPPAPTPEDPVAQPPVLVLVDDDAQVLQRLKRAFDALDERPRDLGIVACSTIQDALNAVADASPTGLAVATDLIIARSDGKGILGGVQLLEAVRERSPDAPVILFTDYQNEEAESRAHELGVLSVLTKPRKAQMAADAQTIQAFLDKATSALQPALFALRGSAAAAVMQAPTQPQEVSEFAAPAAAPMEDNPPVATSPEKLSSESDESVEVGHSPAQFAQAMESVDLGGEIAREMGYEGESAPDDLPPMVDSLGEMGALRSMLAELIDPANRETVTLLVLRFASQVVERAALFLATRRAYVGLGGFSVDEASEQFVGRVRRVQIPIGLDSVFARVSKYRAMVRSELHRGEGNERLVEGLGGVWPKGASVAAPLVSGDRVAAILYGDNPSGKPLGSTESLEIFLQQAGLAMDRALLERKLEESKRKGTKAK